MSAAVIVDNLSKSYGTVRAVNEMSWSAPAGQITAVLGPNGAGKTTTMECIEGLIRPSAGHIEVLGTDPWGAGPAHRARVGVMLQDGGLPNSVKPLALLRHLSRFYSDGADVDDLVSALGIDQFASTNVRRLSGGQRQRLALASALVGNPEVVFLDEPTAGLDPHARLDAWDLIRDVRDRCVTVCLTTHSFDEAERLADRVVVIDQGRVVAEGALDDVRQGRGLEEVYFSLTRPESR